MPVAKPKRSVIDIRIDGPPELSKEDLDLVVEAIAAQIRVLRSRDGVPVTDAQTFERARNIVCALTGLLGDTWDSGFQEGVRHALKARGGAA